jgi:hypothetical protein
MASLSKGIPRATRGKKRGKQTFPCLLQKEQTMVCSLISDFETPRWWDNKPLSLKLPSLWYAMMAGLANHSTFSPDFSEGTDSKEWKCIVLGLKCIDFCVKMAQVYWKEKKKTSMEQHSLDRKQLDIKNSANFYQLWLMPRKEKIWKIQIFVLTLW